MLIVFITDIEKGLTMSVFKDTNTNKWTCKFRYTNWHGESKQKKKTGFKTKKQAQQWEKENSDKLEGSYHMKLSSLIELYKTDCKARLKPTTIDNKGRLIDDKILPYLGNIPIDQITPVTVRKWQTTLINKGYSPTYLKTINNQLSAILNYGCNFYSLKENVCRKAGSMGKKQAELKEFWSTEDFDKFIATFKDLSPEKVSFTILFYSGMRSGELLALTLNDFDFINNTINIDKNYALLKGQDLIMPPKTPKSKRVISMPLFVMDMVKAYSDKRYDYKQKERIIPVPKAGLTRAMNKGIKQSGVKHCSMHYLRHAHASFLIENGFSPLLVSERLGHEKIETTLQTYSHLYPNKQGEVADKIQEMHQNK
jgi:integrase